ncbi:MAG: dienelactone hydrolase family protein [Cyanobacteria bacterium]|nr:dienelactone hydrolase family protein [Cyanobacteriota bacterium]
MVSNRISISVSDGFFDGYLALPPKGQGPGILIIPEIFGINDHIRAVADRWAEEGYVTLVPDIFWRLKPNLELGYEGADLELALSYLERFDAEKTLGDLRDSSEYLRDLKTCSGRVAALGFCLGGGLTYRLAACFNLNAAVCYYGVEIEKHLDESPKIRCKTLLHFAELDQFVTRETYEIIEKALSERPNFEIHRYMGVDHGFNCDARGTYNKEAADLAHERSRDMLKKELGLRD